MIIHTFINKCNTIIENSEYNTGLNPVAELNVGDSISRILINFDISKIKEIYKNNGQNINNLKHYLKMTNCGSVNLPYFNEKFLSYSKEKERAASFNVIAFKIPIDWDEGRGFDYYGDYAKETHCVLSKDGSNWEQAKNYCEWDEYGVYSNETLIDEYEKFINNEESIIIATQHFDNGTENLNIDITNYINEILVSQNNFYGIGISFEPTYEYNTKSNRFISFFTNHTNTFFHPYVETVDTNIIMDSRYDFHIGCNNKLYLFVSNDGEYVNLDKLPKCTIGNKEYEVKQNAKGAYYIDLFIKNKQVEPNSIIYDVWSNLELNGNIIDDIEMEFVALPFTSKVAIGNLHENNSVSIPQIYGINDHENLKIGDIRELRIEFIEEFSHGKKITPSHCEYRLYVKENNREIDVHNFHPIERRYDSHLIFINTNELIPNTYHVDIKVKQGNSIKIYDNVLQFNIVNNVTNIIK